ncbi:MAG: DNA repair protein RecN [Caldilineaceae bacterium]
MLHELHIRNFAIIDDLRLNFGPGLNILTGETGAGKSIIIDALGMLLGDRASTEWIRAGADIAAIEATFRLPALGGRATATADEQIDADAQADADDVTRQIHTMLEEQGLDDPDSTEWVQLGREVRANGRNICRVNGRMVNLQILSDISSLLIDVHGQGEHLNLLRPRTHIHLLDRYAGLLPERARVAALVRELRGVRAELSRLRRDERTIAQRLDLLNYQVDEIVGADLQPAEDNELEAERRRLGNAETLITLAQGAQAALSEEGGDGAPCALDLVGETVDRLERLARIDPDMEETVETAQSLLEQLSDLARALQDYGEQLEFNPERLQEVEDRLELINNLKRKYGDTIEQINTFGEKAQSELDELGNWEVRTAELEDAEEKLLHAIGKLAAELSQKRRTAGELMARQVVTELADLRMERAQFCVAINQTNQEEGAYLPDGRRVGFDATGVDQVEFLMTANPGEPLRPLAKVASGGETARIMLALKSVLAHADATPTLIFDEIDQGIGGRVGAVVGQKLWKLTGFQPTAAPNGKKKKAGNAPTHTHQVLCITHLPQLAAFGDAHFTVNKRVVTDNGEERTGTVVQRLSEANRLEELMLMLGATTDAGRQSVQEMLAEVRQVKGGMTG